MVRKIVGGNKVNAVSLSENIPHPMDGELRQCPRCLCSNLQLIAGFTASDTERVVVDNEGVSIIRGESNGHRGSTVAVVFQCESCKEVWRLSFGFHKGELYESMDSVASGVSALTPLWRD